MKNPFGEDFSWTLWPGSDDGRVDAGPDFLLENSAAPSSDLVISDVFRARCFAFKPKKLNGRAVLVLAGGGYTKLVIGKEGVEIAQWLANLGFHAFVLVHRFPNAQFGPQAPVDDAMEALRQIRARAPEWGVNARAVGVLGLSSGGHLASCLVAGYPTQWTPPPSKDAAVNATPDFLIVGYGPISTNASGRTIVPDKPPLPPPEKQALYEAMQPDVQLMDSPPPAFIVYAANDAVVPVENAYRLHKALLAKGGSAELHVFADAPHGFALREKTLPVGTWPGLCEAWLNHLRL
ncbi:MAG: alpha/beta hydrolase [Pseudomonadota bacterium]